MKTLFVVVILTAFIACNNNSTEEYTLTLQETLDKVSSKDDVLSATQISDILLTKDEKVKAKYQFVDIRTPYEFNIWHVPGAVNIPSKHIFGEEYDVLFRDDNIIKILYCKGSHQSMNSYTELIQKGYSNIKVSLGGYNFLRYHIIDTLDLKGGVYNEDSAIYNYAKIVEETAGAAGFEPVKSTKPTKKVVRRKKKEVEGGCG